MVTAAGAHWLLGMDWNLALLLGAIVSSTDAAAVFAVLRSLPLPRKVTGLLEAESGFNDAPAVILVLVLSTAGDELPGAADIAGHLVYELAVGGVIGLALGRLGAAALRHIALPATGLYPLATVGRVGPGQRPVASPRCHPFLRRRRRLARPDRPVRHARATGGPQ